jgi:ubiquinone/menaquinone biosynthesis C-methylase UbiE
MATFVDARPAKKPDYGNWVSKKFVFVPGVVGVLLLGLAVVFSPFWAIFATLFIITSVYFAYARYQFAQNGKDVQGQIRQLVLDNLDWDGKGSALDIGCGNGALTVALARRYPEARLTGIDYWGGGWGYSQTDCEENAAIEGVADGLIFRQASASALPFDDGHFDLVVSNLVFHEVKDTADKRQLVREALRVVKTGGKFALQDLFLMKPYYGEIDNLLDTIRSWGIREVRFIETRNAAFIPGLLKLPFMAGTLGLIVGEK